MQIIKIYFYLISDEFSFKKNLYMNDRRIKAFKDIKIILFSAQLSMQFNNLRCKCHQQLGGMAETPPLRECKKFLTQMKKNYKTHIQFIKLNNIIKM